jgi:hypothetical protein
LTAGELSDRGSESFAKPDARGGLLDKEPDLIRRGPTRETEAGAENERFLHGQFGRNDIILRHIPEMFTEVIHAVIEPDSIHLDVS